MRYDLGDCTLWEYMFLSNEKPQLQIPEDDILDGLDEDEVKYSRTTCVWTILTVDEKQILTALICF